MLEKILITVFTICISLIFCYIYVQNTAPDPYKYISTHKKDLIFSDINTFYKYATNGDLIFMAGDTDGEKTCRWFTSSHFNHVGMLFREKDSETNEDILYIWDADLGQHTKDGPRISKISDKFRLYHGYRYFMWRKLNCDKFTNRPSTKSILEVVKKYKDFKFDNDMRSWFTSDGILSYFYPLLKDESTIFCSELIALTMQDKNIGMMIPFYKPGWYSPKNFDDHKPIGIKKSYSYGHRNYIKF